MSASNEGNRTMAKQKSKERANEFFQLFRELVEEALKSRRHDDLEVLVDDTIHRLMANGLLTGHHLDRERCTLTLELLPEFWDMVDKRLAQTSAKWKEMLEVED
jgi:hypothetical protein